MAKYKLLYGQHRVSKPLKVKDEHNQEVFIGSGKQFLQQGDTIESEVDLTKKYPGKFELVVEEKKEAAPAAPKKA